MKILKSNVVIIVLILVCTLFTDYCICHAGTKPNYIFDDSSDILPYHDKSRILKSGKNVYDFEVYKHLDPADDSNLYLNKSGEYKVTFKKLRMRYNNTKYIPAVRFQFYVADNIESVFFRNENIYGFDWYKKKSLHVPYYQYDGRACFKLTLFEGIEQSKLDTIAKNRKGKLYYDLDDPYYLGRIPWSEDYDNVDSKIWGANLWTTNATVNLYVPKGKCMMIYLKYTGLYEYKPPYTKDTKLGMDLKECGIEHVLNDWSFKCVINVKKL